MTVRPSERAPTRDQGTSIDPFVPNILVPPGVSRSLSHPGLHLMKRLLDIVIAITAFTILSPFLLFVVVMIRLDSPGDVFYQQWRVGKAGKPFRILKFRTMHATAGDQLEDLIQNDPGQKVSWEQYQKLFDDPRLTRIGRVLRRLSIDELPQLWNILKGDMSVVGPRPFLPEQKSAYGKSYDYYIQVRPGLTGLWQVNGRNWTSFTERARWDEYYVSNWSILLDVYILFCTVGVVLRGDGAY